MGLCVFSLFVSCSPRSLHEARSVVAEADSLWMEGGLYSDSAQLAQAYTTLEHWQRFYADDYAHACYHYGKLLRKHEDPVSAMQVFINATHSPSHDYHILGRVYNNVGDICHQAGEFTLSCEMFEQSSVVFLRDDDTLSYYYCLNDMAYELAEMGKKEETLKITNKIDSFCTDKYLQSKLLETKAVLYREIGLYDSVIYYANKWNYFEYPEPTIITIKAQAYDNLGKYDSALIYANMVLKHPYASAQNKFNSLYIVRHCDSTLCIEDIDSLYTQREDLRYFECEPQKEKLILSVQLLQQDLSHRPNLTWLYTICATLTIMSIVIYVYIRRKRRHCALLSQQLDTLNEATLVAKKKQIQIANQYHDNHARIKEEIERHCELLRRDKNIRSTLMWKDYETMCSIIDQRFYMLASKLRQKQVLNETGLRLCILVLLNMSRSEISEMLPYSLNSIGKLKDQTAKLLGTTGKKLHDFLLDTAIEG